MITKEEMTNVINGGNEYITRLKCHDTKGNKEYFNASNERFKTALKGMYGLDTLDDIYACRGDDTSYMDEFNQVCECFGGR